MLITNRIGAAAASRAGVRAAVEAAVGVFIRHDSIDRITVRLRIRNG